MTDYFLGGEGPLSPADAAVALIVLDGGRYLMQLRDQKPGIFYPGHWGVFGGAVDPGETLEAALTREMQEELGLAVTGARYFTEIAIDFSFGGSTRINRRYFELTIAEASLASLVLGEGAGMRVFTARDILATPRVVPYDALAIWMHATRDTAWPGRNIARA